MKVSVGTLFPKEGDWCWAPYEPNPKYIVLGLPSVGVVRLRVVVGHDPVTVDGEPAWVWNGSLYAPTLVPSIDSEGGRGKWHGYLRDGELIPA